ncbi:MAG TPA: CocE/NonD family hydrolase [Baekduia sp.]|jgi:hypothetical protein|nr:CocE/NonD family hydrolase [Baekduia sp.]
MHTNTIIIDRDVPVPMADGTTLRADVWRAAEQAAAGPALLQRTPYGKGASLGAIHHQGLEPARAVDAGWSVVIADVRGRCASDGAFDPFFQEPADGADAIAWLREQPWCDGRVATYGTSYCGAAALLAAGTAPDGLMACSTIETAAQYHDGWTHRGGAVQLSFLLSWVASDLLGVDPAAHDLATLAGRFGPLADWLAHPDDDAFWRAISPRERWGATAVCGLHIGGWSDLFLEGTLETYAGLRDGAATPAARAGQRLVVGPWAHGVTGSRVGELDFGPDAPQDALDLTAVQLDFVDAVRDDRLDEIAPVRLFVMGADAWQDEDAWPPARMVPTRLHLHPGGALRAAAPPAGAPSDTYTYDPADPVPTTGGPAVLPPALGIPGPADQRAVQERPDVLVYTSDPLTSAVELIGTVHARLWAATSAADTDWTVKLVDVHPDGRAMSVTDGIVRARYREGLDRQVPPVPGEPAPYDILVGSTALRLAPGHRLAVEVSSSNFPRFDAHPNHAGVLATSSAARRRVAHQTILHDADHPSSVLLPVTSGALS